MLGLACSVPAAGIFPRTPGGVLLHFGYYSIATSSFFSNQGRIDTLIAYRNHNLDFYGEFGLGGGKTLTWHIPLLKYQKWALSDPQWGLGDLELNGHLLLGQGRLKIAAGLGLGIPTGDSRGQVSLLPGAELLSPAGRDSLRLPFGDGEWNLLLSLLGGLPVWRSLALSFEATYNLRTRGYADVLQGHVRMQYEFHTWPAMKWQPFVINNFHLPLSSPDPDLMHPLGFGDGVFFAGPAYGINGIHGKIGIGVCRHAAIPLIMGMDPRWNPRNIYADFHDVLYLFFTF